MEDCCAEVIAFLPSRSMVRSASIRQLMPLAALKCRATRESHDSSAQHVRVPDTRPKADANALAHGPCASACPPKLRSLDSFSPVCGRPERVHHSRVRLDVGPAEQVDTIGYRPEDLCWAGRNNIIQPQGHANCQAGALVCQTNSNRGPAAASQSNRSDRQRRRVPRRWSPG